MTVPATRSQLSVVAEIAIAIGTIQTIVFYNEIQQWLTTGPLGSGWGHTAFFLLLLTEALLVGRYSWLERKTGASQPQTVLLAWTMVLFVLSIMQLAQAAQALL